MEHFEVVLANQQVAIAKAWGVRPEILPQLPKRATSILRDGFARTRSVRTVRRHLESLRGPTILKHGPTLHCLLQCPFAYSSPDAILGKNCKKCATWQADH